MGLVLVQAEALHTGLSLAVKDASLGGLHVLPFLKLSATGLQLWVAFEPPRPSCRRK